MTRVVSLQNNIAVPMTRLHESMTSSHLGLRGITDVPHTQATAQAAYWQAVHVCMLALSMTSK